MVEHVCYRLLNEQAKDLKLDAGQKEKLKQAAQQMTALAIGAAAGAVLVGQVKP